MLVIAYTKNQELADKLTRLDELRKELHVLPLSRNQLYAQQWNTTLSRISTALTHQGHAVTQQNIEKYLADTSFTSTKAMATRKYKSALDLIRTEWYVNPAPISPHVLSTLDALVSQNKRGSLSKRTPIEKLYDLKQLLTYIQSGDEHPVIQAGIVYVEILQKDLIPHSGHLVAILLATMMLSKQGWDFRELINYERLLDPHSPEYRYAYDATKANNNATIWLSFVVDALITQTQLLLTSPAQSVENEPARELQPRLIRILALLDSPTSRLTNKNLQEKFGISQITSSRDLAKLADMGLVRVHAKGRSTYYTKI